MTPAHFVMLLSEGFGGTGGIARFNSDFIEALAEAPGVAWVDALPRRVPAAHKQVLPDRVSYDVRAALGAEAFLWRTLRRAVARAAVDVVICAHIHLLPPAWLLARLRGARLVLIIHGYEAWSTDRALVRPFAGRVDAVVAVSELSARRFAAWTGVPAARRFVLPNAVDLNRFTPGPRDAALATRYGLGVAPVIMTLGRMAGHERGKGFDKVIELMPDLLTRFPGLTYLIVGDGDDRPRLMRKAAAMGLRERVVFAGAVTESEKVAHYRLADVFIMPSKGEGFGIVLIEAAACGLAVIGSSRDGSREALLDGELGQLVDPDDDAALIAAIAAALKRPRRRHPEIVRFSSGAFRARVAHWVEQMAGHASRRQRGAVAQRRLS